MSQAKRPGKAPEGDNPPPAEPYPSETFTTSGSLVGPEARPDAGLIGESLREALPSDGLGLQSELIPATQDGPTKTSPDADKNVDTKKTETQAPAEDPKQADADKGDSSQHKGRITLIVGVSLLLIVILFTILLPNPNRYQWLVFGMLSALGGACIATVLSGFLEVESKGVKAGGALAVFAVVFYVFYSEIPERSGPSVAISGGERMVDSLLNSPPAPSAPMGVQPGTTGDLPEEDTEEDTSATAGPRTKPTAELDADTDALFAAIDEPAGGR